MVQRPWKSTQTLQLPTDMSWQQENLASVFHAGKIMPVGLSAGAWYKCRFLAGSVRLNTLSILSKKTSRAWQRGKKWKKGKNSSPCVMLTWASPACRHAAHPDSGLYLVGTKTALQKLDLPWGPPITLSCSSSVTGGADTLTPCCPFNSSFSLRDCPTSDILLHDMPSLLSGILFQESFSSSPLLGFEATQH